MTLEALRIETRGGTVRLSVHVQPRAAKDEIVGQHGTALKVRVQAPPVDGAANSAVVALIAARLRVPRRDVRVVAGESSRAKTVEIDGTSESAIRMLLTPTGKTS